VLITSGVELWLYKRLNILSKGCYLVKNMNVPSVSKTVYDGFLKDGFDLYCQEQESSILFGEFNSHLNVLGINKDQSVPFKGVFCWGKRDAFEYKKYFESKKDIFFDVGSVRLEVWKEKYAALWQGNRLPTAKPYILVVSNFSYIMGDRHWSTLSLIHRHLEMLESHLEEETFVNTIAQECKICCEIILAVKHLARKNLKHDIVFRPHPADSRSNWENIFCDDENVSVIENSDSISPWIQNARVIIHNGCTSAIEAAIRKVPIISYGPDRVHDDLTIPNMVGIRAHNLQELDRSLEIVFEEDSYEDYQENSEHVIDPIVSLDKESAALEMIKIMERKSCELLQGDISGMDILSIRVAKFLKKNYDLTRRILGVDGLKAQTNHLMDERQVQKEIKFMSEVLDLPEPKVTWVSKTCLLLG
jgi:surface carbohydrate biosynthesis protein